MTYRNKRIVSARVLITRASFSCLSLGNFSLVGFGFDVSRFTFRLEHVFSLIKKHVFCGKKICFRGKFQWLFLTLKLNSQHKDLTHRPREVCKFR